MITITIPRKFVGKNDLVVIPRKELEALIARAGNSVTARDVLRWSRDAKKLRRIGKLAKLA